MMVRSGAETASPMDAERSHPAIAIGAGETICDVLARHARERPTTPLYSFIVSDIETQDLTFAEFHRNAMRIASALGKRTQTGDRVALLFSPGQDYIVAFVGCLFAGVVAVPCYPPRNPRQAERTARRLSDSGATLALTAAGESAAMRDLVACRDWLELSKIPDDEANTPGIVRQHDLAFIQYTSGSTSDPKGVMITHGNLVANATTTHRAFHFDTSSVHVTWLPPYHDMGLIGGLLQAIFSGCRGVVLSPVFFMQRPLRWLEAITRFRGTHSGGPNFAFELCAERIDDRGKASLDLTSWQIAFCGSEPIRADTMDRFAREFASCGFKRGTLFPCYGMAEATLLIACAGKGEGALTFDEEGNPPRRIVSSGRSVIRSLAIVDPETGKRAAAGTIGEIWIAGDQVAPGYWGKPELSGEAFGCLIADDPGGEGFFRTGDLGFLRGEELLVSGRLRDMVILNGQNIFPQDVEVASFESDPALRVDAAAAFGRQGAGGEELVVVQELNRREQPRDELFRLITASVFDRTGVPPDEIVLVKQGTIPRTTSGKIQRSRCRADDEAGRLTSLARRRRIADAAPDRLPAVGRTQGDLERWILDSVAQRLGLANGELDAAQTFAAYGVSSLMAAETSEALGHHLGRSLPATLLWDFPTPRQLAAHLAESGVGAPNGSPGGASQRAAATPVDPDEPIAVIGLGCRLPMADGIEAFWALLCQGTDAVRPVSPERLAAGTFQVTGGEAHTRIAGFLDEVEQFDPGFFGIAPAEAAHMDPQQRLLLETVWRAFEHAGIAPASLAGTATGVFVGISNWDYAELLARQTCRTIYDATGNAFSVAANRLSYLLDLRGPSLAVDTACSSSLVAVHLACQSLRRREATVAVAAGVNLILSDRSSMPFVHAGLLSPDGRCRTFDGGANGYVRGEGVGAVVLKRLSDAQRDGDPIRAVILGSAVGQDGRSNGLTAPSGTAQQAVLRQAIGASGLRPHDIEYVEAHGTGTRVGDPIELNALGAVVLDGRGADKACLVGSVKTNIGHLEAAAGIAGLIKVALMIERGSVPPHLHFEHLNPQCRADPASFLIPRTLRSWPSTRRTAGVSSLGFGGTLAHVVLGAASPSEPTRAPAMPCLLTLSAKSGDALDRQRLELARTLRDRPELQPADVAHVLNVGRNAFARRRAFIADDRDGLIDQLEATNAGAPPGRLHQTFFLFPGQGAQRVGMARELYRNFPAFREKLDRCAAFLVSAGGSDPREALYGVGAGAASLQQTAVAQPALFAVSYALAESWLDLGVQPRGMLGHSLGEYVAACLAGVLSLQDAAALVTERGRLMQALPPGAMLAVELGEDELGTELGGGVCLAAVNGPRRCVVSGPTDAVHLLERKLAARDVGVRRLPVSHAFHSNMMLPVADRFAEAVARTQLRSPTLPFVSNVSGTWITAAEATSPAYWVDHLLKPVRFHDGVLTLLAAGDTPSAILEVGPSGGLASLVRRCRSLPAEWSVLGGLPADPGASEFRSVLEVAGRLWTGGQTLDWRALHNGARLAINLPGHPFEHSRHWLEEPGQTTGHSPMPSETIAPPADARADRILPQLQILLAELLEMPVERIDPDASLLELGADSLVLVRAIRQIEHQHGLRLGIRQLFEELPSLRLIAGFIEKNTTPEQPASQPIAVALSVAPPIAQAPARATSIARPAPPPVAPSIPRNEAPGAPVPASRPPLPEGSASSALVDLFGRQLDVMRQQVALLRQQAGAAPAVAPVETPVTSVARAPRVPAPGPPALGPTVPEPTARAPSAPATPTRAFTRAPERIASSRPPEPLPPESQAALTFSLSFFGLYDAAYAGDKYDLVFEAASFADRHGFAALWLPERHFHAFGGLSPNPSLLAAALARETRRIALRAGSVVLPLHHPVRIAEEWAMVDNLSGGRVGIAAASGWHSNDFLLAPDDFEQRRALTFERLEQVRSMWRSGRHLGRDGGGQSIEAGLFPMPRQAELPVWVTVVGNPDTYRQAGAIGAGILTNLMGQSVEELAANLAAYRDARRSHGHPGNGDVTVLLHTYVRDDAEQARRNARAPFKRYLASSIGLFETFARSMGVGGDFDQLDDADRDYLLDAAFERYAETASLIGDPAGCEGVLTRLREIGVSDIGCFVDFGLPPDQVIAGLPVLDGLRVRLAERPTAGNGGPLAGAGHQADGTVTLSLGQQRMWVTSRIQGRDDASYNMPAALRLGGPLDVPALAGSLVDIVERHTPLRTVIADPDGVPTGRLLPPPSVDAVLPVEDCAGLDESAVAALVAAEGRAPFDLGNTPPFRARLLRLQDGHLLLLTLDHSGADGVSLPLFAAELSAAYAARQRGLPPDLPRLPVTYADYAAWQRQSVMPGGAAAQQFDHWQRHLAGAPALLELPTDHPRDARRSREAGFRVLTLAPELVTRLTARAASGKATLFATLLAGYAATLGWWARQDDVVIGVATTGRSRDEANPLIGYFSNVLPVRLKRQPGLTIGALVEQASDVMLDALANGDVPLESLVEKLGVARSPTHAPLIQATISWQGRAALGDVVHNLPAALRLVGVKVTALPTLPPHAPYDLVFDLTPEADGSVRGSLQFDSSLFAADTIARLAGWLTRVFDAIAAAPDQPVDELDFTSPAERHQLLHEWNDVAPPTPDPLLPALFEAQASRAPNAVAISCGDASLSYAELNSKANRLAHHLIGMGVGPGDRVALCVPRSLELVAGLLAILKAGAAYLPLDPDYPAERLRYMIDDAAPKVVVTTREAAAGDWAPPGSGRPLVLLDDPSMLTAFEQMSAHDPSDDERMQPLAPEHLAYVIYTSGSTGRPKGVEIPHSSLSNFLCGMQQLLRIGRADTLLAVTTFAFDISGLELFLPLVTGARVVVAGPAAARDPAAIERLVHTQAVTMLQATPSLWRPLLASRTADFTGVHALVGGEALTRELASSLIERTARVTNLYGPTETTIWSTAMPLSVDDIDPPPIGRPIRNTQAYVLDDRFQLAPVGVTGELYLAGKGLARGYHGRAELTGERFVACPYGPAGSRMYRTGDLARWRPDGRLEFFGRADQQIKLRGFRVEPGEIESALLSLAGVARAAVIVREDRPGHPMLVGYVVGETGGGAALQPDTLRVALGRTLPDHMVPAAVVMLDHLPLTPNGKLDRRALPPPTFEGVGGREPRTPEEETVAGLFAEVLGVEQVSVDDNFFNLGGNSLDAMRLQARVRTSFGVEMTLKDFFAAPDVAAVAEQVSVMTWMSARETPEREDHEMGVI